MKQRLLYIPLDERPCNARYPHMMLANHEKYELVMPSLEQLSKKKQAADVDVLWDFIFAQASEAKALVVAVEMLIYGGLLPSRLHHLEGAVVQKRLANFEKLKKMYPQVQIYASNLIMRTPQYSSSDEEPDYYGEYGAEIFERSALRDRKQREGIDEKEQERLNRLEQEIPKAYIDDYEQRRQFNLAVNEKMLSYVEAGVVDFLVIPQDDSAPYGYTAQDQRILSQQIQQRRLMRHVQMYPGADEVGATLLARVYNHLENETPKIYIATPSVCSEQIVPLYEDRPMGETVRAHIRAIGGTVVATATEADFILGYNTPGKKMQESWDQLTKKDITYTSYRHLVSFVEELQAWHQAGKAIVIADCAFANGGEIAFVELLDEVGLLEHVLSYKGWNTNANTVGTTLAAACFVQKQPNSQTRIENIVYHILEDLCYQAIVRRSITETVLPPLGLNYFDLGTQAEVVNTAIDTQLRTHFEQICHQSFRAYDLTRIASFSPWNRMFEIGIDFELSKR